MGTILLQAGVGKYCTVNIRNGGSRTRQPFHNTKCCMLTYRQPTLLSNGYSRNRVWRTHSTDILAIDYWYWHFLLIRGKWVRWRFIIPSCIFRETLTDCDNFLLRQWNRNNTNYTHGKDVICVKVYRCILKHVAKKVGVGRDVWGWGLVVRIIS